MKILVYCYLGETERLGREVEPRLKALGHTVSYRNQQFYAGEVEPYDAIMCEPGRAASDEIIANYGARGIEQIDIDELIDEAIAGAERERAAQAEANAEAERTTARRIEAERIAAERKVEDDEREAEEIADRERRAAERKAEDEATAPTTEATATKPAPRASGGPRLTSRR